VINYGHNEAVNQQLKYLEKILCRVYETKLSTLLQLRRMHLPHLNDHNVHLAVNIISSTSIFVVHQHNNAYVQY